MSSSEIKAGKAMWRELTLSAQVPPFVYTELFLTNREVYPGVGVVSTQNPRLGFAQLKVSADNTILSQQAEKKMQWYFLVVNFRESSWFLVAKDKKITNGG